MEGFGLEDRNEEIRSRLSLFSEEQEWERRRVPGRSKKKEDRLPVEHVPLSGQRAKEFARAHSEHSAKGASVAALSTVWDVRASTVLSPDPKGSPGGGGGPSRSNARNNNNNTSSPSSSSFTSAPWFPGDPLPKDSAGGAKPNRKAAVPHSAGSLPNRERVRNKRQENADSPAARMEAESVEQTLARGAALVVAPSSPRHRVGMGANAGGFGTGAASSPAVSPSPHRHHPTAPMARLALEAYEPLSHGLATTVAPAGVREGDADQDGPWAGIVTRVVERSAQRVPGGGEVGPSGRPVFPPTRPFLDSVVLPRLRGQLKRAIGDSDFLEVYETSAALGSCLVSADAAKAMGYLDMALKLAEQLGDPLFLSSILSRIATHCLLAVSAESAIAWEIRALCAARGMIRAAMTPSVSLFHALHGDPLSDTVHLEDDVPDPLSSSLVSGSSRAGSAMDVRFPGSRLSQHQTPVGKRRPMSSTATPGSGRGSATVSTPSPSRLGRPRSGTPTRATPVNSKSGNATRGTRAKTPVARTPNNRSVTAGSPLNHSSRSIDGTMASTDASNSTGPGFDNANPPPPPPPVPHQIAVSLLNLALMHHRLGYYEKSIRLYTLARGALNAFALNTSGGHRRMAEMCARHAAGAERCVKRKKAAAEEKERERAKAARGKGKGKGKG